MAADRSSRATVIEMLQRNSIAAQKRRARARPELLTSVSIAQACAGAVRTKKIKIRKKEEDEAAETPYVHTPLQKDAYSTPSCQSNRPLRRQFSGITGKMLASVLLKQPSARGWASVAPKLT